MPSYKVNLKGITLIQQGAHETDVALMYWQPTEANQNLSMQMLKS